MPGLYLITGSNGAGKSTIGPDFLPSGISAVHKVFDGDKLLMSKVAELWPFQTKSIKEARRIASEFVYETLEYQVEEALIKRKDYVYEGHFPSYATWDFPKRFKAEGYEISMLFLGLKDPDICC